MQRLIPLKVPWQVSPSTPFLRLYATESAGDQPTQVVFVANFGLKSDLISEKEAGFTHATAAINPYNLSRQFKNESKSHTLLRLKFNEGLWARMSPAFSDREVIDPMRFDTSLIPYSNPPTNIGAWLLDFQSLWLKSGYCPDPCAYSVESSQWINELSLSGFEHFVIQGHDAYVEVLARGWEWDEVDKLPEVW